MALGVGTGKGQRGAQARSSCSVAAEEEGSRIVRDGGRGYCTCFLLQHLLLFGGLSAPEAIRKDLQMVWGLSLGLSCWSTAS